MYISPNNPYIKGIKLLIWTYILLLIFEGSLRKWVLPQLAAIFFAIRAPVVLMAYAFAFRVGVFPWNAFVCSLMFLGGLTFFVGLIPQFNTLFVAIIGAHSNFFHLPFIFLMAKVMNMKDIKAIGTFFLALAIPMAVLMVLQFKAGPFSYLNIGAGGMEGVQLGSAQGRIRPAGTFAFATGPALFYGVVSAFLAYGFFKPKVYSMWLLLPSAASLVAALAVSGSRSLVASCGCVVIGALLAALWQPWMLAKFFKMGLLVSIVAVVAFQVPVVQEGYDVLRDRFMMANASEGGAMGTAGRIMVAFTRPVELFFEAPLFGHGLGMGTNAGAKILTGERAFILYAEAEWDRVMLESGPIFGTAFIFWRIALTGWLGWSSLMAARKGHLLPLFIWSTAFLLLLIGQFGPATTLGFTVLMGGLCLTSLNTVEDENEDEEKEEVEVEDDTQLVVSGEPIGPDGRSAQAL
ncbi:hypothetical protein FEM03_22695 [Phragmitibacter flavus]|uniref:O-antigen ligase family protein n=1 Tax=Phragmitibacter flavus TaxID=2576071 RepID=A0A5R8K7T8_9BACT|nr:hypothetical protein [Phragmitibacter flavus]TLD68417.1 hypothetical protein FEM03_22695 [Phragmitibacter flavus]